MYDRGKGGLVMTGAATIVAAAAVCAAGMGLALFVGRRHRKERNEMENFFSSDPGERAWWEERR